MARPIIEISITREKVNGNHLYKGNGRTVLDAALFENKDGPDKYGYDGFVSQRVSKEARERGEKGVIIGNWKWVEKPQAEQAAPAQRPANSSRQYQAQPAPDPDLDAPEAEDFKF